MTEPEQSHVQRRANGPSRIDIKTGEPIGRSLTVDTEIEIDGLRCEWGGTAYVIKHRVGEIPTVVGLDVVLAEGLHFNGSAYPCIMRETADLLIALGWTPPPMQHLAAEALADDSNPSREVDPHA